MQFASLVRCIASCPSDGADHSFNAGRSAKQQNEPAVLLGLEVSQWLQVTRLENLLRKKFNKIQVLSVFRKNESKADGLK